MMRWAAGRSGPGHAPGARRGADGYRPVPLSAMGTVLPEIVVLAEDARFRHHWGIDPVEIREALGVVPGSSPVPLLQTLWRRRHRIRGASTITQQLAKNLYLSPSRNPLRKLKEALTALRLEAALSKDRILELYLNTVELGPDLWGVQPGSRAYFGADPAQLTVEEAAALAATLPHPRTSNPAHRPRRMQARQRLILDRYYGGDVDIPAEPPADTLEFPPLTPPLVRPGLDTISVVLPVDSIPADTVRPLPP